MPSGRAVLLLRRLSTGDSRFKNIAITQGAPKENCVFTPCYRNLGHTNRLTLFCHQGPPRTLTRSISNDNFIKMSSAGSKPEETHKHTNRLINEKSPYLLQHAHNPVDWYPWGTEAIEKAKSENKLIFLSIGYSTCHWCHVMEKESFENENVAKIMNKYFINIKVDREERPDIDKLYMLFVVASTGSGGWPMSVFLDPNLRPVTGGTYYPPEDKWGRPGFVTLLTTLASKWQKNKEVFETAGNQVMEALNKAAALEVSDSVPGEEAYVKAVKVFERIYEPEFGGFGMSPKFPQASIFNFLFHFYARNKSDELGKTCLDMCLHTLTKIAYGGIHDHVSSGFARYSVDNEWHVPHFEKMLYDQAQLTVAYTDAYLATKNEFYADVVRDIIKYVNRDLSHKSGGFYSAEDADSYPHVGAEHKREGAFCVWEYQELESLLGDKSIKDIKYLDIFCEHYNVDEDGNISPSSDPHSELAGQNVLIVYESKDKLVEKYGLSIEEIDQVLKECIDILYEARQKRPRPHLDTKMLCSWNGLMISGLSQAGQGLGEKAFVDRAIEAANFIKKHLYDDNTKTLLRSSYRDNNGEVAQTENPIHGFLDDYAFLIKGLLDLYEASLEVEWLTWARELQQKQDELFWDDAEGGYFTSPQDSTVLLRLKEDSDGAEPSGNSVSCHNLLRLAAYADKSSASDGGDAERERAKKILLAFSSTLKASPSRVPEMMSALMFYNDSPTQVLIAGGRSDPRTLALVRVVRSRLLPGRVLAVADPILDQTAVLARIKPVGDAPTAYVCRRFACSLPVTDVQQLEKLLDETQISKTR